jgi:preprotein translocase subunit SecB
MTKQNTGAVESDRQKKPIALQKIYLKDCSFESPNSPAVFTEQWSPTVQLNMQSSSSLVGENTHEVVLRTTLEAKLGDKTALLVEVVQAGIFEIRTESEEELKSWLAVRCPEILYPYSRQVISDLATQGGFPQLLLQPMNFEELFARTDAAKTAVN